MTTSPETSKHLDVCQPKPRVPITQTVSPEVEEDEADEMDTARFRGLKAAITRAELERSQ